MRSDPDAVLLDLDGTLVDTEGLWWEAVAAVAGRLGRRLGPDDVPHVRGRTAIDTAAHLLHTTPTPPATALPPDTAPPATAPLPDAKAPDGGAPDDRVPVECLAGRLVDAFAERLARDVPVLPGARELLAGLAAASIPTALVTASPRRVVDLVLPRLRHSFHLVIADGDTARGKPYPDPYLEAARRLGTSPARCVAVEDSPAGIAAATSAGCRVLAVTPRSGLPSAHHVRTFASPRGETLR
ncbi:HAD family hydrolase [Nonomuraea sp. NPDC050783]|uniref:HAD family hydrolase n=1 Tax=Nonomuraea sp. NPDC050783 TaxID=3154634 RepID=UPI00346566EB